MVNKNITIKYVWSINENISKLIATQFESVLKFCLQNSHINQQHYIRAGGTSYHAKMNPLKTNSFHTL